MTSPLMLDASGKKFGKSEGNAIWLDPEKNSPYKVYQFLRNTADNDVEKYLKAFTLMELDEIQGIIDQHTANPEQRYAQQRLASYMVAMIFGQEASIQAEKISQILFNDPLEILAQMQESEINALCAEVGSVELNTTGKRILELIVASGLASSNGEAKKLINSGALFLNETKITDPQQEIQTSDLINQVALLRKGKKSYRVIRS